MFGNSSRNLLSSSSVNPLTASDLCRSLADSAASSLGAATIYGVRKMMSSVLSSLFIVRLNRLPSNGISPNKGILVTVSCLAGLHQAADDHGLPVGRDGDGIGRTDVNDRGVDDAVPFALAEMGMERVGSSSEIWGDTIISTSPVLGDERA